MNLLDRVLFRRLPLRGWPAVWCLVALGGVPLPASAAFTGPAEGGHVHAHAHDCGSAGCRVGGGGHAQSGSIASPEEFRINSRWSNRLNAARETGVRGDGITLTYGVVQDGTVIEGRRDRNGVQFEDDATSNLRAFLNANVGSEAVWTGLIDQSYQRWGQISGLTMIREDADDSRTAGGISGRTIAPLGEFGVRADMRIGGRFLDGQDGSNTLAYNYSANHGDHVVDTGNTDFYSNPRNNFRGFRNVFMHEAGHGLGFSHVESNTGRFLMEPFISTAFDGPQHDDLLAVQRNYGDRFETGGGNDSFNRATGLGSITPGTAAAAAGSALRLGADASDLTSVIGGDDVDFVSIDGLTDRDVYGFTLTDAGELTFRMDPRGPVYNEGPQDGAQQPLNTKALSDLAINILDAAGGVLAVANDTGAGFGESITAVLGAGDYFALIRTGNGAADNVQLYDFSLSAVAVPEPTGVALLVAAGGLTLLRRRDA